MSEQPQIIQEQNAEGKTYRVFPQAPRTGISAFIGESAFTGMLAGAAARFLFGMGASSLALPLMAGGFVVGAIINKMQTAKEDEQGIEVAKPSMLNKGMLHGLLSGITTVGTLASLAGWAVTTAGFSALSLPMLPILAVGAAVGAFMGGKTQENMMAQEYNAVQQAYKEQETSAGLAKTPQRAISPEQDWGYHPAQDKTVNFTDMVSSRGQALSNGRV